MQLSFVRVITVFGALAAPALAQISSSVGPTVAPAGGRVAVAISNDGPITIHIGDGCPYRVTRASDGAVFYDLPCPLFAAIRVPPGAAEVFLWDQRDNFGNLVPPDTYVVTVVQPDGALPQFPVVIGGVDAALTFAGSPRIGTTRRLFLTSPPNAGLGYIVAASTATSPGIPTCGGIVPLFPDAVFLSSLAGTNAAFLNFAGALGPVLGDTLAPGLDIPADPALVGVTLSFAFVALDFGQPCIFAGISPAEPVTFQ